MIIRTALPVALLLGTVTIGMVLLRTPPEVPKSEPEALAAVVGVAPLDPQSVPAFVEAYGTVVAAREARVQPEVTGRIVAMHEQLTPGGLVPAGEILFEIERADYEIAVREAEASLAVAQLQIESLRASVEALRGRAEQVEAVLAYLRWNMERLANLSEQARANEAEARDAQSRHDSQKAGLAALRAQIVEQERNVDRAVAEADAAESRLAAAELALSRTKVTAPFDAMVLSESVELSQLVGRQSTVATLVATDEFWVEAAISVTYLKDIRFSDRERRDGSRVKIKLVTGVKAVTREGIVLRPLGALDPQGRMARVLVSIPDPLRRTGAGPSGGDAILLGSYVRLSIEAGMLHDVCPIPRFALRENDCVWVRTSEGTLGVRRVDVVWRRQEDVLIRNGFAPGDELVTTHLASVVPGMRLQVRQQDEAAREDREVLPGATLP